MANVETPSVAEQYIKDGYHIVIRPQENLPDFLAGFEADMLAEKEGESVVVKLVTKDELRKREHHLEYWIGKVNSRPGWRFDLVITDPSPWPDKVAGDASDLEIRDVRERNREARRTLDQGFLEPACLFAWALVEASLRLIARTLSVPLLDKSSSRVIHQLYVIGLISVDEFDQLQRSMAVRNAVAHGLKTSDLNEALVIELISMTEKFLSVAERQLRMAEA